MRFGWSKSRRSPSWLEEWDRRRRAAEEQDEALRLLRSVRRVEIRTRRAVQEIFSGEYHSAFKGQGIEFAEVREYIPGDDVRLIDRNVSARMRHPFVKVFHEERELTVVFLVDRSASMRFGSGLSGNGSPAGNGSKQVRSRRESAAELVAVLAFSAVSNNDKVGCLLFSAAPTKWIAPGKGRRHALRVVREVLSSDSDGGAGTSLASALELAGRVLKRRSILFLVSDFLDDGWDAALSVAARRHEVVPLVLFDRAEADLPEVGLVDLLDLETGERRLVDTSDPVVRRSHSELWRRRVEEDLPRRFRRARTVPVFLPMDGDSVESLHRYFERRVRTKALGR